MMGPHVMAALTPDTRKITADADDVATLVSDVPSGGRLVTIHADGNPNAVLRHDGQQLRVGSPAGPGGGMAATFRMDVTKRYGAVRV
jgi:hypothetical protein